MRWYIRTIKRCFDFKGRARRKEYWMFALFNVIFQFAVQLADNVLRVQIPALGQGNVGILSTIYSIFILIPSLSVSFRRLHDINRSAWWLLIALIPIIGWVWIFVFTITEGIRGENRYGFDPKEKADL